MKIKASKRYKKLLDNSKDKKAETIEEAEAALHASMLQKIYGESGKKVVIEIDDKLFTRETEYAIVEWMEIMWMEIKLEISSQ